MDDMSRTGGHPRGHPWSAQFSHPLSTWHSFSLTFPGIQKCHRLQTTVRSFFSSDTKKTRSTPVMSNSIANNDTFFHKRCNRRTSTSSTRSVFQFPALLINHGFSKRWIYDAVVVVVPKQTKHNSTEQTHTHETQDEDRRRTIGVYKNQRPTVSANPHLLHEVGVWKETQMNQHHSCNSSRIKNHNEVTFTVTSKEWILNILVENQSQLGFGLAKIGT